MAPVGSVPRRRATTFSRSVRPLNLNLEAHVCQLPDEVIPDDCLGGGALRVRFRWQ